MLFSDFLNVWWREVKEAFSDFGVLIFVILVPLAYPLLYYYVYSTEVARDVPAVVVDDSNSNFSREFIRKIDACPEMAVVAKCTNLAEAQELMKRQEVYGVVRIPASFADDIVNGRQTYVGVYTDLSSMIYYKNILMPCSNVSVEMNKSIKVQKFSNLMTDREQEIAKAPITYDWVQMYNPQGGYASFMIPPILMIIIQQTMLLGMGVAVGRVRERNRGYAVPDAPGYNNPLAVVLAKVFLYAGIYLVMGLYMYAFVTRAFLLPQLSHYWSFISLLVPFVLACASFSAVCTLLIYRREDSILLFVFMSLPLLFVSGVSWPASNIPVFWKWVSLLFPSTFGTNGYIRVGTMGVTGEPLTPFVSALWIQFAVYLIVAFLLHVGAVSRAAKSRS